MNLTLACDVIVAGLSGWSTVLQVRGPDCAHGQSDEKHSFSGADCEHHHCDIRCKEWNAS